MIGMYVIAVEQWLAAGSVDGMSMAYSNWSFFGHGIGVVRKCYM